MAIKTQIKWMTILLLILFLSACAPKSVTRTEVSFNRWKALARTYCREECRAKKIEFVGIYLLDSDMKCACDKSKKAETTIDVSDLVNKTEKKVPKQFEKTVAAPPKTKEKPKKEKK